MMKKQTIYPVPSTTSRSITFLPMIAFELPTSLVAPAPSALTYTLTAGQPIAFYLARRCKVQIGVQRSRTSWIDGYAALVYVGKCDDFIPMRTCSAATLPRPLSRISIMEQAQNAYNIDSIGSNALLSGLLGVLQCFCDCALSGASYVFPFATLHLDQALTLFFSSPSLAEFARVGACT